MTVNIDWKNWNNVTGKHEGHHCTYKHVHKLEVAVNETSIDALIALSTEVVACMNSFEEIKSKVECKYSNGKILVSSRDDLVGRFEHEIEADKRLLDILKIAMQCKK